MLDTLLSSADFCSKLIFSKISLNTIRVSNGLDHDGPDLGPNILKRLSTYDKNQQLKMSKIILCA